MSVTINKANLNRIIAPDMKEAAEAALRQGEALELYTGANAGGQTVQVLVVAEDRAGLWMGGTTAWGEWDEEKRGVRLENEQGMLLNLNGEPVEE